MNITDRLSLAWKGLTGQAGREIQADQEEILSLQRRLAEVDIELLECRLLISAQKSKIEAIEACRANPSTDATEDLFTALAPPLSQLRMQEWLISTGKEISGRSVMALAAQFASLVEKAGLEPVGEPGERTDFDPGVHEPLSAQDSIPKGASVIVRFIGYRYKGRMLRRALVQQS